MSRRLLISALPGETRAVWLRDGRLHDVSIQRADRPAVAGNVYLGRVAALDRALEAAFVEIGLARPGFLPLSAAPKGLSEGQAVLVRAVREPRADKGARLGARGRDLPPGAAQAAAGLTPPALVRAAADPIATALADPHDLDEIRIDDPATFARARAALVGHPALAARLALDLDPAPLFEREGIEEDIEALLAPRVALPSGGGLLVEPVETLTAIDVDSGRDTRRALAVDLEAAAEIRRQLRLRNLSGLIVVDFLGLADGAARARVVDTLKRGVDADGRPARVHAMRPSGLVEMTRQRVGPALHELLSEPCGLGGGGRAKDPVTIAFEALRAVRADAARAPGRGPTIIAPPRVVDALQGPVLAAARRDVAARLGYEPTLRAEPGRDGFEIVP